MVPMPLVDFAEPFADLERAEPRRLPRRARDVEVDRRPRRPRNRSPVENVARPPSRPRDPTVVLDKSERRDGSGIERWDNLDSGPPPSVGRRPNPFTRP
jgi:hypothetical protein